MSTRRRIEALFRAIAQELESNPGFAERVAQALGGDSAATKRGARRARAVLDPIAVLRSGGERALRDQLQMLDIEKLKDIVAEYGMDTAKLVMKWKTADRIVEHIVTSASMRSRKGDAFRER